MRKKATKLNTTQLKWFGVWMFYGINDVPLVIV